MADDRGIDELARLRGAAALDVLEEIMEDGFAEDRDRVRAAEAILDRGYGKPSQAIIAVPATRRQAALLAGLSDDQLVAIIEQKQLPRIGAPQPMITVSPRQTNDDPETPRRIQHLDKMLSHGPADETYSETEIDPLLL